MIGVAVVLVGIATMIVGVWVWQLQAETDARAKRADRNAQITCLRAVKLAPYSTRFLQQADVYPKDVFTTFQGSASAFMPLPLPRFLRPATSWPGSAHPRKGWCVGELGPLSFH